MAMLVADELISNAVHNAPVDASGVHYRKELPRDRELPLDERQRGPPALGLRRALPRDRGHRLVRLARPARDPERARAERRPPGSGGAGMGLALTYRSCDQLVFNIAPGARTEIVALIDVRYPPSERTAVSSYNVFVERARPA